MDKISGYRRLFIMRKDLGMSAGKLASQVGHCAEAYWTQKIRKALYTDGANSMSDDTVNVTIPIDYNICRRYVEGTFTKTICEARNKNHLMKAVETARSIGLVENVDYGIIRDNCLTEITPEEDDGTTITGIWFKPLPDEVAHEISKKYQLYH